MSLSSLTAAERRLAPALMVQGTASHVGKSLLVAALCRLFKQDGLRVAPFKAQNMALNSYVTATGGEIGRAQATQAEAAGVAAEVDMNPVLIKPEGDARSQIVVLGKVMGSMTALEYHRRKPELMTIVRESLERLRRRADLVVIEGAGSPAEINLKQHDIVNMAVARAAGARVLLVADIDRGGVFASLVGTMELLDPDERALVGAHVINKFRGDPRLLQPGLEFLVARTGVPVLGVLPFLRELELPDEDSLGLEDRRGRGRASAAELEIAVVRLPRISNFDDFAPLEHEPDVVVRFVERPADVEGADLVILPGSKTTVADLTWLRGSGLAAAVAARAARGAPVLGVCGGCQMLGEEILDPEGMESTSPTTPGLGLLPVRTRFARPKVTAQVRARLATASFLGGALDSLVSGYQIHMGRLEPVRHPAKPTFTVLARNGAPVDEPDGAVSASGAVVGTLIHGLFEDHRLRAGLLGILRERRGLPPSGPRTAPSREGEYDRLAAMAREHLDLAMLRRIAGLA
jgi:adenosylcobyric acid synthase